MADSAVIFDVDGVLLELTAAEEDLFFEPFERRYGLTGLSRDWNSYRIRNDEQIVAEILERHGLPASEQQAVINDYLSLLARKLADGSLATVTIPGAATLLRALQGKVALGIATANFREAARLRLQSAGLWQPVTAHARGADGSGHKWQTVAALVSQLALPPERVVYVGDNLNDVEAGLRNGLHFIGFATDPQRRRSLKEAGALHTSGGHSSTLDLISTLLRLD